MICWVIKHRDNSDYRCKYNLAVNHVVLADEVGRQVPSTIVDVFLNKPLLAEAADTQNIYRYQHSDSLFAAYASHNETKRSNGHRESLLEE